jgi:hypothetical protein
MSAVPAARYLEDFSLEGGAPIPSPEASKASEGARLDEAFAHGVDQGRAAAASEYEAKLEQQQQAFAAQLAAERAQWAAAIGAELAARMEAGLAELQSCIAEATARILKPFLAAELHRQAIAELQAHVAALLATDSAVRLEVTGPPDVLEAMRRHTADRANITFSPSNDGDVRVIAGQATLQTQLKSWLTKLDEAVP